MSIWRHKSSNPETNHKQNAERISLGCKPEGDSTAGAVPDTAASSPPGELCPVNGRSPGSVSTQHSSPRSDAASASGPSAVPVPAATAPQEGSALQTSDVVIHRKENEGFGFVIISSLNRPENATVISELLPSGALKLVPQRKW